MYAVIDTETTGLNVARDRIIEIAIIGLNADGRKQWEWCSLINPGRDTGGGLAKRVHQIYERDVASAPTFEDYAGYIADVLAGRALIAHNAKFDFGMLAAEFGRLGVSVPPAPQICTADLARDCGFRPWRLTACCTALGIEIEGMHHALADARATWCLAHKLFDFSHDRLRMDVVDQLNRGDCWPTLPIANSKPVMRPILPARESDGESEGNVAISHKANKHYQSEGATPTIEAISIDRNTPEMKYLAAVEWVLEDREISPEQKHALEALREELALTERQVREVHMKFLRGLSGSMWDDGNISKHERFDIETVGKALLLSEEDVNYALQSPLGLELTNDDYLLSPGERVVFTGEMSIKRSEWIERAKNAGLSVTGSVSGKTNYLVVPFGETGSSKSKKARKLGVRVVTEQRFLRMIKRLERSESVSDKKGKLI